MKLVAVRELLKGQADCRSLLIARHEQFARSLTEKLMTGHQSSPTAR
ncbi:hypothetical protein [Humisphaera borealis]|uniref:Uncharacterized protein n=1 Tax=Humisphaera borealis TaxID=2807512 RepID=A0A7M2WRI2_9BACT|nr:hypothetical protein [Humisphaera borealis]QOV88033.1 hypothetical protein IPV69_17410 [Humisphaera borealis]